jgi:hypothetical protein
MKKKAPALTRAQASVWMDHALAGPRLTSGQALASISSRQERHDAAYGAHRTRTWHINRLRVKNRSG